MLPLRRNVYLNANQSGNPLASKHKCESKKFQLLTLFWVFDLY